MQNIPSAIKQHYVKKLQSLEKRLEGLIID
jgi:hypothetical protein